MELRQMTFGENLNEWFRVLGRQWKPLLIASVVAFVPVGVGVTVAFWAFGAGESFEILLDPELIETITDEEVFELMGPFLWATGVWILLQVVATVFIYLFTGRVVALDRAQAAVSTPAALRHAMRRLGQGIVAVTLLIVLSVVAIGIAFGLGWLFIDALGVNFVGVFLTAVVALTVLVLLVWVGLSLSFYAQVLAMEPAGATESITRSFALVSGHWWLTLGFVLVTSLITSVVAQALSVVLLPVFLFSAAEPILFAVAYGLTSLIQGPVVAAVGVAYAVWYISLRAGRDPTTADQLLD